MIHRHKHEMTLKFPSIKNDNMLSGELRLHQYSLTHALSRVHRELVVHLQVCASVTHGPDTLVYHQETLWRVYTSCLQ